MCIFVFEVYTWLQFLVMRQVNRLKLKAYSLDDVNILTENMNVAEGQGEIVRLRLVK